MKNEINANLMNLGNLWEKNAIRRIYLSTEKTARALGYDFSFYSSGNISSASRNGESISNSEMKRVLRAIDGLYYDLNSGTIGRKPYSGTPDSSVTAEVESLIKSML